MEHTERKCTGHLSSIKKNSYNIFSWVSTVTKHQKLPKHIIIFGYSLLCTVTEENTS